MARNGKGTAATREPRDYYDSLSPEARDIWDEIGALGYRIKPTGDSFEAYKPGAKELAGPCDSLGALLSAVKAIDAQGNTERQSPQPEPASGSDGYLFEEMKPTRQKDIPELNKAIMNYESYKTERIDALNSELKYKKEVEELMQTHKADLAFEPSTGIHTYRYNDYIEDLIPGEEKLKSRRAADDDDE